MARVRRVGGFACAGVALVAVLAGWLQPTPDLSTDDARSFTEKVLADIGLEQVRVSDEVTKGSYTPSGTDRPIDVWQTSATVAGGRVMLKVNKSRGEAVFVDDVASDGSRLLTHSQFTALGQIATDPARDRRFTRNLAGSIGGLLVASVATLSIATLPHRPEDEP